MKKFYQNKKYEFIKCYNINKTNTISFTNISIPSLYKGKSGAYFGTGNNSSGTINSQLKTPKSSFYIPTVTENMIPTRKFIDNYPGIYIDQYNSAIVEWHSIKADSSNDTLNDTPSFISSAGGTKNFEEIRRDDLLTRTKTRTCLINKTQLHTIIEENIKADNKTIM